MLMAHIRRNFAAAFYPRLSEWVAAGVTLLGGWVLIQNPTLMIEGRRGYGIMLSIASQPSWAAMFFLLGFARLVVLLINGAILKSPWLRAACAFLCCGLWMSISISLSNAFGLGFVMAFGYLSMDMLNIHRAMRDARTVDDMLRGRALGTR